ncbi:MAG: hypothetical protein RMK19_06385 [Bacteroidia bacterium]|nr:DUF4412 domain-containing protein [Bacteroidia bacterium]MDW8015621.1 hypothetical protein [Bacteroidia bacterium]
MSRVILFAVGFQLLLRAQQNFEGMIVYTTKIEGAMAEQLGEMLKSQVPEKIKVYYRGNKVRNEAGDAVVLIDGDAGTMYLLSTSLRTYRKAPLTSPTEPDSGIKITKTKDKTQILKYPVQKYLLEVPTVQGKMKMEVWVTPELRVPQVARQANNLTGGARLEGVPLRSVTEIPGVDLRIVFLATQIDKTPPDESLFRIPSDYVEETGEIIPKE